MLDTEQKNQAETAAVLNLFPYLDKDASKYQGLPLSEVMEDLLQKYPDLADKDEYQQLAAAIEQNPSLGDTVFLSQSSKAGQDPTEELIQAASFQTPEGDLYVSYRGTGNGRWVDNGVGMTVDSTQMQKAAAEYFDTVMEKYGESIQDNGGQIIVTGHSKGGNEAQYVNMASEHEDMITACYSFDGQGFSNAAVEKFQSVGEEYYNEQVSRMYSICGTNDFVNVLGNKIISEENTYYVDTTGIGGAFHSLQNMLGTDGESRSGVTYSGLSWADSDDRDGHGTQKDVSLLAEKLSEKMMKLDESSLDGTARTVMNLCNKFMNKDPKQLGQYTVSIGDRIDFVTAGLPVAGQTLLESASELKNILSYVKIYKTLELFFNAKDSAEKAAEELKETADAVSQGLETAGDKIKQQLNDIRDSSTEQITVTKDNVYSKTAETGRSTMADYMKSISTRKAMREKKEHSSVLRKETEFIR